jgi:SAM-dependent methyltransferase
MSKTTPGPSEADRARWESEASFFDARAQRAENLVLSPKVLERYGKAPHRWFHKDYRFRVLGDVRGKRILDVGCGDGSNAVLLAALGAHVTGLDVAPQAIAKAEERARLNGVTERTRFVCTPIELADFKDGEFDVVWGDAILHHVIPNLPAILAALARWTRPGGLMVFAEPVNRLPALRALRLRTPIALDATPDERPLEEQELALLRAVAPNLQIRPFHLFARFNRYVLPDSDLERAAPWRRALVRAIWVVDYGLLSLPGVDTMGGYAVLLGAVGG